MSNTECKCEMPNTDLSGRCFKCGGNLIFPKTQLLSAALQKELDDLIMKHTLEMPNNNDYQKGMERGMEKGIEIGATAYATKLHELQQEFDELHNDHTEAKILLTEVFQKHESGLLPDRFIYEKIKRFLYGE